MYYFILAIQNALEKTTVQCFETFEQFGEVSDFIKEMVQLL